MRYNDKDREINGGPLVLIIEDDPGQLGLIATVLSARGYDVRSAETGKDGLDQARRLRPDLILVDVRLPDTNGVALHLQLGADPGTSHIPVVMMTALDRDAGALKTAAEELGARAYLQKPFSPDHLEACVRDALVSRTNRTIQAGVGAKSGGPPEPASRGQGGAALRPLSCLEAEGGRYKTDLSVGLIKIDGPTSEVTFAGRLVKLPPNALTLLVYLMMSAGRWIPWDELHGLKVGGSETYPFRKESGTVQVGLSRLKAGFEHKIDDYFEVRRGYGIKFQAP